MAIKLVLNTRIKFNGKEYSHTDEMPADVRQIYDRVMVAAADPTKAAAAGIHIRDASAKIIFNGREYGNPNEMPADIRQTYERMIAAVEIDPVATPGAPQRAGAAATSPSAPTLSGVRSPLNLAPANVGPRASARMPVAIIGILILVIIGLLLLLGKRHSG